MMYLLLSLETCRRSREYMRMAILRPEMAMYYQELKPKKRMEFFPLQPNAGQVTGRPRGPYHKMKARASDFTNTNTS